MLLLMYLSAPFNNLSKICSPLSIFLPNKCICQKVMPTNLRDRRSFSTLGSCWGWRRRRRRSIKSTRAVSVCRANTKSSTKSNRCPSCYRTSYTQNSKQNIKTLNNEKKKKIKIGETNTLNHNFNSFLEPRSVITLRIYPQTTTQAIRVRGGGKIKTPNWRREDRRRRRRVRSRRNGGSRDRYMRPTSHSHRVPVAHSPFAPPFSDIDFPFRVSCFPISALLDRNGLWRCQTT